MNYIDPRFDSVCKTEEFGSEIWYQWRLRSRPLATDSGDEQPMIDWNAVFAVPEELEPKEKIHQELVARDLKVKCETPEERERLWNLIIEVSRS